MILIIAFRIRRRASGEKADFMPGDAATPKVREAVAILSEDLDCITRIEALLDKKDDDLKAGDAGFAAKRLAGARRGISPVIDSCRKLQKSVETMTPTHQNALGLYRGLRDSDASLWASAQALDVAGVELRELSKEALEETPDAPELGREIEAAGNQLRQMSSCLYGLVRSVHHLGSSLDLE